MTRTRRMAALPMACVLTAIGLNTVTAHADPGASCSFKLSAPSVVNASGTDMVMATLSPGACTGVIQPNSFTVCVEMKGSGTPVCKFSDIYDPVSVYFTPYRKGATYSSTGRGCGNVFPLGDEACFPVGPHTATL